MPSLIQQPTQEGHYAIVDVHYSPNGGAWAGLVIYADLRFSELLSEHTIHTSMVPSYESGKLYLRELPAIRTALQLTKEVDLLVVDGYVDLDPQGRAGLGARAAMEFNLPVIGVAKSRFHPATHAIEVYRGRATRPLYVTAVGIERRWAASIVQEMDGQYRLPDAIKRADALARQAAGQASQNAHKTLHHNAG